MCGLLRVLEKRKDPGRVRARLRDSCPGVVFLVWGNPEVYAERKTSRKDTKTARVCRAVFVVSLLERSLLDEHARERREGRLDFGAHVDQFRSLGIVAKWCLFGTDRLFVWVREKKRKVRGGREFARRRKIRTLSVREENSNEKSRSHENCGSNFGGRRGIRTLDTEFPYAAFPGRYNQPLCHPSISMVRPRRVAREEKSYYA